MSELTPEQAQDAVLYPILAGHPTFQFGPHTIQLRPLPIKHAKILSVKVKPFEEFFQRKDVSAFDAFSSVADLFVDSVAHLLSFYGLEGASKAWIEETVEFATVRELIATQLGVQKRDDFLLIPLRMLSDQMIKMVEAVQNPTIVAVAPALPQIEDSSQETLSI